MHSRNFRRSNIKATHRSNGRQGPRNRQAYNNRSRRFSGNSIDIRMFMNKAVPAAPQDDYISRTSFEEMPIHPLLKRAVARRGFERPMPIQEQAIPHILAGKDVIGLANTGTGKTAAFLLPIMDKILRDPRQRLLVVVPTRELALQIQQEFDALAKETRIKSTVVVGGANIFSQVRELRTNPHILIGTPGRLKDLIQRKYLALSSFNNVVLDEADQMLDMGFINDVRYLLSLVSPKRQTLLFSATLSRDIEQLVHQFLTNPVKVSIKTRETSAQVDQDIVRVEQHEEKIEKLHSLLSQENFQKVLIFTRTKYGAEKLSKTLYRRGFKTESIHGNKTHGKRQRALKMFKEDQVEILVATDIAARGLDIPNVSHVINYDVPATYEDYVHRIGRTGRADKTGKALTFVN